MAAFSYQALNADGKKVKGVLEGDSPRQIRQMLREKGLKPLDISHSKSAGKSSEKSSDSGFSLSFLNTVRLNPAELALFTRQLATLIQSSLPLDEALQAVADQTQKQQIKSLILDIRSRVVEGHSLAYALGDFPKIFDSMYRAMVTAGESAGFLGIVLERLADYTENSQYTQQKIKSAMVYPIILMIVAFGVITGLMVGVVPDLVKVFDTKGADLPVLTKGLIWLSDFIIDYGIYAFIAVAALIIWFMRFMQKPSRKRKWHVLKLRLPLIRGITRTADTARFASTLSMLVGSGVPLLDAIRIASAVLNNMVLRDVCTEVAITVQEGGSFGKALGATDEFPPMLVHMVSNGEASGELEAMLEKVAQNQEREIEMTLTSMLSVMEPLMIVIMSGIVMMIVMAILLPIMDLNTLV
ncbi:Type II secretion system protein F [BD1-7 clade bacterium]|uniref:General secretion pathway protein F n=1 Tax=BD1-7 clade bacterium TaxID=2029982 RepID=A0A5S9R1H5_9GAMM|nr:Type II secretion system protein F [BD1-7 clade bacterium]